MTVNRIVSRSFPLFWSVEKFTEEIMETKRLRHSLWFFWSDWRKVCATSAAVVGEPLARRSAEEAGTGRGRLPPAKAALEVTRP
ncbi:MAG: hypothetical protein LJE89_08635 [Deltaproteobacteria bacterium]|nr:hypothetical protein [Deltaproteobacteria bacterium]